MLSKMSSKHFLLILKVSSKHFLLILWVSISYQHLLFIRRWQDFGGRGKERRRKCIVGQSVWGMGFKDFYVFNDALLGRQIWRLIHHKNSLLRRLMQAKYYPHGNIPEVRGFLNSFSWRSIWSAKSLVSEGLIWRVGNGCSVNIWSDPWVGDKHGRFIESERVEGMEHVRNLINFETME